jgi:hypothetical protein
LGIDSPENLARELGRAQPLASRKQSSSTPKAFPKPPGPGEDARRRSSADFADEEKSDERKPKNDEMVYKDSSTFLKVLSPLMEKFLDFLNAFAVRGLIRWPF